MLHAKFPGPLHHAWKIDSRNQNHWDTGGLRVITELRYEEDPIHHRDHDIDENDVGFFLADALQSYGAVVRPPDMTSFVEKLLDQQIPDVLFVLNNQGFDH